MTRRVQRLGTEQGDDRSDCADHEAFADRRCRGDRAVSAQLRKERLFSNRASRPTDSIVDTARIGKSKGRSRTMLVSSAIVPRTPIDD